MLLFLKRLYKAIACSVGLAATSAVVAGAAPVDFEKEIQPLLSEYCLECHGPDPKEREAGLRLDTAEGATTLLSSGQQAVIPTNAAGSALVERIFSRDPDSIMPPPDSGKTLTNKQKERLRQWIEEGAPYVKHWAYRPISRPPLPHVETAGRPENRLDVFVLHRLEGLGMAPSPEADLRTLLRRLYLDLLGLLPPAAEVEAFESDDSANAYARQVDRLLASPRFGERWGRHWLDKARYADSDGYEKDNPRPNAWRYRDWVIDAINADLPFDQFTIDQLAGDLLPGAHPEQHLATAFHRQTLTNTEGGTDQEQWRVAAVMDRTETTGTVWLGLTIGCARCHTHKFDAITQAEYYQLYAFFNNGDESTIELPAPHADEGSDAAMKVRIISQRRKDPRPTHILERGDFTRPAEAVEPDGLEVLPPMERQSGDRLDLARWLIATDNPLTPRVVSNQIWAKLFGEGLVRTLNDFGIRGDRPTHPELLDEIARRFVELEWSRKALIREILLSRTYRQASEHRPELADRDPTNRFLYRQNRFRVEAEIIRDLTLDAAGLLTAKIGGPSVFPPTSADVVALTYNSSVKWEVSRGEDRYRRGMYTFFKRTAPHPNLITFDCPDSNTTTVDRRRSNTPLAALTTLNNSVFHEAAQAFAKRALRFAAVDDEERLTKAFAMALARPPRAWELNQLSALLRKARQWYREHPDGAEAMIGEHAAPSIPAIESAAWTATLRVLLNLDEFLTRS